MENNRVEQAVALFTGGMACSQAILATYGPLFGFDRDEAIRIARGFGGGMGRLSETCWRGEKVLTGVMGQRLRSIICICGAGVTCVLRIL